MPPPSSRYACTRWCAARASGRSYALYTRRMAERRLWRIVRSSPPTTRDFTSHEALGHRPRNRDPETLRLWSGLSMSATERLARRTARSFPELGSFVAEVAMSDDA